MAAKLPTGAVFARIGGSGPPLAARALSNVEASSGTETSGPYQPPSRPMPGWSAMKLLAFAPCEPVNWYCCGNSSRLT